MSDPNINRRRFVRVHFNASCNINHEEQNWKTELLDISFRGLLINSEEPLPLKQDDHVMVSIHLSGSDIVLNIPAHLSRIHLPFYGFTVESMDLETLSHLRRLVELNLGDSSLFDRELEQLVHHNEG